jgi:DNA-binding response OmpR family regulator
LAETVRRGLAAEDATRRNADGTAADGVERLACGESTGYDAIVLDITLPRMSSHEVVRRLRAAQVRTRVTMLRAKDGQYAEADVLDLGADDYLAKTVLLETFISVRSQRPLSDAGV